MQEERSLTLSSKYLISTFSLKVHSLKGKNPLNERVFKYGGEGSQTPVRRQRHIGVYDEAVTAADWHKDDIPTFHIYLD